MSRLHIQHRTTYSYSGAVKFGMHRMVLRPREGHNTKVLHHLITLSPPGHLTWMTDVHGNHVAYAEIPQPAAALVILNEVVLEIPDPGGEPLPPARQPEASLPLTYLQTEQELVNAYFYFVKLGNQRAGSPLAAQPGSLRHGELNKVELSPARLEG